MDHTVAAERLVVNQAFILGFGPKQSRRFSTEMIDLLELERKLGKSALRVWALLHGLRDDRGMVHPTRSYIAQQLGMTVGNVARCLRRLLDARLVIGVGKRRLPRQCAHKRAWYWRVHGIASFGGRVMVPEETIEWCKSANQHGGRRVGAGRPRTRIEGRPKSRIAADTDPDLGRPSSSFRRRSPTHAQAGAQAPPRMCACARNFLGRAGGKPVVTQVGGNGVYRAGWRSWLAKNMLPPDPGRAVPIVRVPPPPLLSAKLPLEDQVAALIKVYRAVYLARTGERTYAYSRGKLHRARGYKRLTKTVAALIEYSIPPGVWIQWRWDIWDKCVDEEKVPPVPYLLDPEKIHKNYKWFRREYTAERQVVRTYRVEAHRKLCARYAVLLSRLGAMDPRRVTREQITAEIDRAFPDGAYGLAVQEAIQDAAEDQARVNRAASRGETWMR